MWGRVRAPPPDVEMGQSRCRDSPEEWEVSVDVRPTMRVERHGISRLGGHRDEQVTELGVFMELGGHRAEGSQGWKGHGIEGITGWESWG